MKKELISTITATWNLRVLVSIVVIGIGVLYVPSALYILNLMGMGVSHEKDTIGIEIRLKNGWFPFASSQTAIANVFGLARMKQKTVAYAQNRWLPGWPTDFTFVSKHDDLNSSDSTQGKGTLVQVGEEQGLAVRIIGSNKVIVTVPTFGLVFVSNSDSFFESVVSLEDSVRRE